MGGTVGTSAATRARIGGGPIGRATRRFIGPRGGRLTVARRGREEAARRAGQAAARRGVTGAGARVGGRRGRGGVQAQRATPPRIRQQARAAARGGRRR
jgi:hypothetical protein